MGVRPTGCGNQLGFQLGNAPFAGCGRAAGGWSRGGWFPPGGRFHGGCAPIVVVAKSVQLRFRLRRKLRSLPYASSPHRAGRGGGPIFVLIKKKMRRARWKRKNVWPRSGTFVPPRCTRVGVRWCLRVCDGFPTGAAGCGADLTADSRGGVRWFIGVQGRI